MGTVLIVDDSAANRKLAKVIVESMGHEATFAEDGAEAMESIRLRAPDLVLMDIQMPMMNGYDAYKNIRSDPALQGITVIAFTSHAMRGDREKIIASGFDDYLTKPLDLQRFREIMNKYIKAR